MMDTQHIPTIHKALKQHYANTPAPVIEFMRVQSGSPFRILVATVLSARTRDETTTQVVPRLFASADTPEKMDKLTEDQIAKLIFPVGFYRTKAKHLKQMSRILIEQYNSQIPQSVEGLCKLPGVGRKTANLVVTAAFDDYGICVDIHVHRISNRWGLVDTKTPEATERALRQCLPKRYWKSWNRYVVAFGQTHCTPRKPQCSTCPLATICERNNVSDST